MHGNDSTEVKTLYTSQFKLQECEGQKQALTFNNFWTKSTASLGPNTWHKPKMPFSSQNSKFKPTKWVMVQSMNKKGHTPHKPSQPRMMKLSLSVRSKEWISGVAITPTCRRYGINPQDYKKLVGLQVLFLGLIDAIETLSFCQLTKRTSKLFQEWEANLFELAISKSPRNF